jgi:hypothetical protein
MMRTVIILKNIKGQPTVITDQVWMQAMGCSNMRNIHGGPFQKS